MVWCCRTWFVICCCVTPRCNRCGKRTVSRTVLGVRRGMVPDRTRRIVEHRDQGCRIPGCVTKHVQIHHLIHWSTGNGPTETWDRLSLCRKHHWLHHLPNLGITGNANTPNGIVFTDADGNPLQDHPKRNPPTRPSCHRRERCRPSEPVGKIEVKDRRGSIKFRVIWCGSPERVRADLGAFRGRDCAAPSRRPDLPHHAGYVTRGVALLPANMRVLAPSPLARANPI
jgi:hypothetical protein